MEAFVLFPEPGAVIGTDPLTISKLTMLLGANSSGKTTILNQIDSALRRNVRDDSHDSEDRPFVLITPRNLDSATVAAVYFEFLSDDAQDLYRRDDPLSDLADAITDDMVELRNGGDEATQAALVHLLLARAEIAFCGGAVGLAIRRNDLLEIVSSIHELYARGFDRTTWYPLAVVCRSLVEDTGSISWLYEPSPSAYEWLSKLNPTAIPFPLFLEHGIEGLTNELDRGVSAIARRLLAGGKTFGNPWDIRQHSNDDESPLESNDQFSWIIDDPHQLEETGSSRAFLVNPAIIRAVGLINEQANAIAPSFLADEGQLHLRITNIRSWITGSPRLELILRTATSDIPIEHCGSGVARYSALMIRLAKYIVLYARPSETQRLSSIETAHQWEEEIGLHTTQQDAVLKSEPDEPTLTDIELELEEALLSPDGPTIDLSKVIVTNDAMYKLLGDSPERQRMDLQRTYQQQSMRIVLLADEPEAHLHPLAIQSVRKWLVEFERLFLAVVVATHSPVLADLDTPASNTIVLRKTRGLSERLYPGSQSEERDAVLEEQLGLTKSELFLMTKFLLFVEGPHDEIVMDVFFGREFRDAGIKIRRLHGISNVKLLAEAEVIWNLDIPIGILADNLNTSNLIRGLKGKTFEESRVLDLVDELNRDGRSFEPFGHLQDDILDFIDPAIVTEMSEHPFPGWKEVRDQCQREKAAGTTKLDWKRFATQRFHVALEREDVRNMAIEVRRRKAIPVELKDLKDRIVSAAGVARLPTTE